MIMEFGELVVTFNILNFVLEMIMLLDIFIVTTSIFLYGILLSEDQDGPAEHQPTCGFLMIFHAVYL